MKVKNASIRKLIVIILAVILMPVGMVKADEITTTGVLNQHEDLSENEQVLVSILSEEPTCPPIEPTCPPIEPTCTPTSTPTCTPTSTPTCTPTSTPTHKNNPKTGERHSALTGVIVGLMVMSALGLVVTSLPINDGTSKNYTCTLAGKPTCTPNHRKNPKAGELQSKRRYYMRV